MGWGARCPHGGWGGGGGFDSQEGEGGKVDLRGNEAELAVPGDPRLA